MDTSLRQALTFSRALTFSGSRRELRGPRHGSTGDHRRRHNPCIAGSPVRSQLPAIPLVRSVARVPGTPFIYLRVVWRS